MTNFFEDLGRFQTSLAKMKEQIAQARRWAPTLKPILIVGDHGTGKKEMALEIISNSSRSQLPVYRWTPDSHGDLPMAQSTIIVEGLEHFTKLQQDLLFKKMANSLGDRSLESPRWIVLAARETYSWVRRGEILNHLYHILSEQIIVMPSLADRTLDVEPLALRFVAELNQVFGGHKKFTSACLSHLSSRQYSKNWQEFFDRIERAYCLSRGPFIDLPDFGLEELQLVTSATQVGLSLSEMERRLIMQTLELTQQNRTRAAEILGISIRTLRNKINEYRVLEGA